MFTKEENINCKLSFLDLLVEKFGELITVVYNKPMFTGLMKNFLSFIPPDYKLNLIKTLDWIGCLGP